MLSEEVHPMNRSPSSDPQNKTQRETGQPSETTREMASDLSSVRDQGALHFMESEGDVTDPRPEFDLSELLTEGLSLGMSLGLDDDLTQDLSEVSPSLELEVPQHREAQRGPSVGGDWPDLWFAACRHISQSVVESQIQAWIKPLEFEAARGGTSGVDVHVIAPNDFSAQWVRDHYQKTLESALAQVTGNLCQLVIRVSPEDASALSAHSAKPQTGESFFDLEAEKPSRGGGKASSRGGDRGHGRVSVSSTTQRAESLSIQGISGSRGHREGTDPRYTFENFVVGASNQFAHASAIAVADQPARQYNPLFLYSPPGLGKTHLLHAIGNQLMVHHPQARVAYLSAEKFVNELIDSLQHRRMPQFRAKYRDSFDLILIDDIQFIAGKNTSEEEFFHTFNALHSSKRQIVVSSDRPPKEIVGLEERVRTRFEWGLIADISVPEIETRIAILKTKAERDDIYLPDDVATFLASHIKSNVRELEGVLIRLQAQASLTGAEISLEMCKEELKATIPVEQSQIFTIDSIQNAVGRHFNLKLQDLRATTRARAVALPRQIAMYLIRKYTGVGLREIGECFGGKDHTTIMHACSKIEAGIENDPEIRDAVEAIQNLL